ncbi:type IV secretion system protein [Erythrobacter sp. LQ02-29]|uniref:type IV secretion system protein n=1 Tax=Erythrobacter sp. LQ02-29 TaxID=2920384 RepID=UPI001F4E9DC7|nr:type IV secretion system protein [Erythrobacter sp. LQ02-29]MCP9222390.1 type IV secretion system protein [Erythrobacter sp. LQ02-29]
MSAGCDMVMSQAAGGVAAALQAVDCVAGEVTGAAFGRLFAPGGAMATVLTILLTLYVAFFAVNLLTGRGSLGVRSLTPRMITLGLVLTFATSWVAYQSVVWNLAIGAPDWLASVLTGDSGSATQTFASKVDVVFQAIEQASQGKDDISAFSPAGMMWLGAMLFMLGTVGVLVTARIALALLVALGPIFVVMALFNGTRGLFTGWLKGVVMLALTPLFAVLGGSIMLEMAVPVLSALTQNPGGEIPQRAAMAFFMIGAVHVALMIMVLKVTGTMVSGWRVFGLVADGNESGGRSTAQSTSSSPARAAPLSTAQAAGAANATPTTTASRRTAVVAATPSHIPANDTGGSVRETRVLATSSGGGQVNPLSKGNSRTSGLGTRFKPTATRSTEKVK